MRDPVANPFASPDAVAGYETWYETTGRRADKLEKALIQQLLGRFPQARSVLEIGCGTGHFTRWFRVLGLQAVGLDRSGLMLGEAILLDSRPCVRGDALRLPVSDDAFDLVALITTLEFLGDPVSALGEALRVCRHGLLLGVLNRHSLLGWQLKRKGGPVWGAARFFTAAELAHLVRRAAAGKPVEIIWRTTLWPGWQGALPLPWGGFIGMAAAIWKERGRET